jgi:integrase
VLQLIRLQQIAWDDLDNKSLRYKLTPLAFLFMFQTGLRIGEVCAIRYEDIEGDVIHLQRSIERDCHRIKNGLKGVNTERWVPLSDEAKRIIEEARKRQKTMGVSDSGYVFSTDDNYLSYRSLSSAFVRYCEKAGIEYRSSHKARKTFISSLIDAGMNINTIREWVGHAEEQTTWGSYCYDRRTNDERKEILESALSS